MSNEMNHPYAEGHIAMTYSALLVLKMTGDDWSRVDRAGILHSVAGLQLEDGR